MAASSLLHGLCGSFRRYCDREEGVQLVKLLDPDKGKVPMAEIGRCHRLQELAQSQGGQDYGEALALYLMSLQARVNGESVRELELVCTCLKTWVQRYIECEGSGLWMTPMLMHLSIVARRVASQLDQAKRSESNADAYLKKLVEIHREQFQSLNRERTRRPGYVWVCCELLRAYFKLGQVSQCAFLLSAVTQSLNKDGFNPTDLPKAICVTFYFYWGKHLVFDHNLRDADERLTWAFNNCPEKSKGNRRRILLYLVPCKLRLGVLPTQALLQKYDLDIFLGVVKAIREGNVQLFTQKMEESAADFIKMGTYLLMMKLKFMVLRNLCKGVHREVRSRLGENADHKLDLKSFEHVFEWQDGCDADETACALSNLIHLGAVKGYVSHVHRKLVFAKDIPFPPPSKWRV
eukprot:TRINITY_DN33513_c0_g1_i1.p1 TRINITY_DN33513_c0_g1~~TRINITY_DN33513_c0_g1_i1.p1  ORF type:complete len:406 (+),score=61.24 TRINITY_DN33513_c0_g1_i1:60-1277(+)